MDFFKCQRCWTQKALFRCPSCEKNQILCNKCDAFIHSMKKYKFHQRFGLSNSYKNNAYDSAFLKPNNREIRKPRPKSKKSFNRINNKKYKDNDVCKENNNYINNPQNNKNANFFGSNSGKNFEPQKTFNKKFNINKSYTSKEDGYHRRNNIKYNNKNKSVDEKDNPNILADIYVYKSNSSVTDNYDNYDNSRNRPWLRHCWLGGY